jgi:hypothetical protein
VFIELTDHLRCTGDHPESFLVLLPDRMVGRRVVEGSLGCPVCGRVVAVTEQGVDFGGEPPGTRDTVLTAPAIAAFLGLTGPGGYLALFGSVGAVASTLAELLPGIRMVLVNPPIGTVDSEIASVLRAGGSPVKAGTMRGVVVGLDHGTHERWTEAAIDAVLSGNRVVVEGPRSARPGLDYLAEAAGVWVARTGGSPLR